MKYEWDHAKAESNEKKHRVSFREAATVFRDPFAITFSDPDHSLDEIRFVTIGRSSRGRVLMVVHLELDETTIRLISARRATRGEKHVYHEEPR